MSIENVISSAIIRSFSEKLLDHLTLDVAIVGGGPSALETLHRSPVDHEPVDFALMWVDNGEAQTIENTQEYFPGLFACGMSANNVAGGYRMGPIFGGMLLSGHKVARLMIEKLKK